MLRINQKIMRNMFIKYTLLIISMEFSIVFADHHINQNNIDNYYNRQKWEERNKLWEERKRAIKQRQSLYRKFLPGRDDNLFDSEVYEYNKPFEKQDDSTFPKVKDEILREIQKKYINNFNSKKDELKQDSERYREAEETTPIIKEKYKP